MPQRVHCDSRREVEVLPVLSVVDEGSLALDEHQRRAVIGREETFALLLQEGDNIRRSRVVRMGRSQVGPIGLK